MKQRITAAEFQKRNGSGIGNQVVNTPPKKPAIRLSAPKKMSKPEEQYMRILQTEFPASQGFRVVHEGISFKLDGGLYSPDMTVWSGDRLVLVVEVKGGFRLGSAGRSHFAFKTARAVWPNLRFRFAQSSGKTGWSVAE